MHSRLKQAALGSILLALLACSGGGNSNAPVPATPANSALFVPDPTSTSFFVPLPNVLATATATDPLAGRAANTPMNPLEALTYVNLHEMGGTNAVSGLNEPIYLRFYLPVVPSSVGPATIKVFQLTPDAAGTENNPLGFTDISATFSYEYTTGGTDLLMFPQFPLQPGSRYLYVVTDGVKDAATGASLIDAPLFAALKSTTAPAGSLASLDAIWADYTSGSNILLRGYNSVMNDLIAASATTTITSRNSIHLMGRFITTGAGFIYPNPAAAPTTAVPVEAELRAFAAGTNLAALGGLSGKTWVNTVSGFGAATLMVKGATAPLPTPDTYWAAVLTAGGQTVTPAPTSVGLVALGTLASGDLNIDPVVKAANATTMDLTGLTAGGVYPAYNPAAGVTQAFRDGTGKLTGFYHTDRTLSFVYIAPDPLTVPRPANGYPVVIYQHGITSQKETVIALAGTLTAQGYALIAIDLPLHNSNAISGHTTGAQWGQDFMAIGAPLATRTNLQQAVVNLNRLEFVLKTGGLSTALAANSLATSTPDITTAPSNIKFVGVSLGAIVGSYYLASNTTLSPSGAPYSPTSLKGDMKGFLNNPGGRTAYLIQHSPAFGPTVDAGLAAVGIVKNSPTYHQFFQLTQAVVDPADPTSLTSPLAPGLPSRLSGRLVVQEATSSTFDQYGYTTSTDGDQVISNIFTRNFASGLGGREVLGVTPTTAAVVDAIAPGFGQLAYTAGGAYKVGGAIATAHAAGVVGNPFLFTLSPGPAPKVANAATSVAVTTPVEGYFQFDQTGISHAFLINPANPVGITLGQRQLVYWLGTGLVVDPTQQGATLPIATPTALPQSMIFQAPESITILGH